MVSLQIWMGETFFNSEPVLRVDYKATTTDYLSYRSHTQRQRDLQVRVFFKKSIAAGLAMGYKLSNVFFGRKGRARMYSLERREVML